MTTTRGFITLAFASLWSITSSAASEGWSAWIPVTTAPVVPVVAEPTTVYQTILSTLLVTTTETLTLTASESLIPITTTEALTSLIICPTRTANPTFTAPGPYPTDWTWGCPPNWLCRPDRIDCNFEAGLPDRNYYCAPNECMPADALPAVIPTWDDTVYGNSTPVTIPGLKVNAIDSFFNSGPLDYGLTYEIFVVNEVYTYYSTEIIQPTATAMAARQAQTTVPGACYPWCNNCLLEAQSVGKTPALCESGSAFQVDLQQCEQCIAYHKTDDSGNFVQIAPQFQQFLDYCASTPTLTTVTATSKTTASAIAAAVTTPPSAASSVAAMSTSTSSIYELISSITYTSVITMGTSTFIQSTLSGNELSSFTIYLPLAASNTTTLYGSELSNATVVLPGSYSVSQYTTTATEVAMITSTYTKPVTASTVKATATAKVATTSTSTSYSTSSATSGTTAVAAASSSGAASASSTPPSPNSATDCSHSPYALIWFAAGLSGLMSLW